MSTSTLSRPARRAATLVVVSHGHGQERREPEFEIPEWATRWVRSAGWDLRRYTDGGPGAAASAAGPGTRALLLRPGTPASARREQQRRPHVVAALAALPGDDAVVEDAVDCAGAADAALTLVHAVPCSFAERSVDLAGAVDHGRRLLDAAAERVEALRSDLTPHTQLLRVRPHELVGEELDADLLVIGGPRTVHRRTDHRSSVQPGGLGLVAHSALHHAPCPVLLTPR